MRDRNTQEQPRSGGRLRAMYPGGRAGPAARWLSRFWAVVFGVGLAPRRWVTLEVAGRRSGHLTRFPLGMADWQGEWYLVPMLGGRCNWVQNVRARAVRPAGLHLAGNRRIGGRVPSPGDRAGPGQHGGGSTGSVTGTVVIAGDQVNTASFGINLTAIRVSGKQQPQVAISLATGRYPDAALALARPVTLPAGFATGRTVPFTGPAEFTLRGWRAR